MFNRRLVAHELRKAAYRLDSIRTATETIIIKEYDDLKKIQNYSGKLDFNIELENIGANVNVQNLSYTDEKVDVCGMNFLKPVFKGTSMSGSYFDGDDIPVFVGMTSVQISETAYSAYKNCSNIVIGIAGNGSGGVYFDGCSNITINSLGWNCKFNDCSNITIVKVDEEAGPYTEGSFENCSGITFKNSVSKKEMMPEIINCQNVSIPE